MLWAERFDRECPRGDALDVQDEIVMTILARTADVYSGTINQSLMETLTAATRVTFTSEEATLLFYRYLNRHCNQSYQDARRALELATPRDPENAILIALLADIRRAGYSLGFSDAEYRLSDSMELARRAVALAPESPTCRLSLGYALLQARDRTELLRVLEPLLADQHLSPCYRGDAAVAVALSGEWQRALVVLDEVLAYMPTAPHSFNYPIFLDAYRSGDYVRAQRIADRFRPSPLFWQPMLRAAVLGQLGEVSRAQSQLTGLLQSRPRFAELGRRWLSCFIMEDSLIDAILEGLDKAGLEVAPVAQ